MGVITHNKSRTHMYKSYHCMMYRCYDKNHKAYKYYGGRKDNPIKVCDRWHNIENFLEDAEKLDGYSPDPDVRLTLDRIDCNKDYSFENCRWATNIEQQNNKRNNVFVEWKGKSITVSQLARIVNVNYNRLYRIYEWNKEAMSIEDIVNRAIKKESTPNLAQVARDNEIPYNKLYHLYITKGIPLEDALKKIKQQISTH